ncbi:WD40 repeat domain-containing protein [bacterium]|nr:MAG: WD40 repeat domain-containing protein [bacterium]
MRFKFLILASVFIFSIPYSSSSQTIFEDAVALNFKVPVYYNTAMFNTADELLTAKLIRSEGNSYIETGQYDESGNYIKKALVEIKEDFSDIKIKFNKTADKIATLLSQENRKLFLIYDLSSGKDIYDMESEDVTSFDFSPDGRNFILTVFGNTVIYDITEGNLLQTIRDNVFLSYNPDGTMLFCKSRNDSYNVFSPTGALLRTVSLKDYKGVASDPKSDLVAGFYPPALRIFKYGQFGITEVKNISGLTSFPHFSPAFDYFVVDDNNGLRRVFNISGTQVYQSKIEPYTQNGSRCIFSNDEKKMVLLTDKELYYYDFQMIKYFRIMSKRYSDIYLITDQFQTDQDLLSRADRIKSQKKNMLNVLNDELKVYEMDVKTKQKNSLGYFETKVSELGNYNPNTEMFDVTIVTPFDFTQSRPISAKVKIPKGQAEIFSKYWQSFKVTGFRQLNDALTGIDVANVMIINNLNSTNYRCIIHRSAPLIKMSYDEQYLAGQKFFEQRNWYDAILYLSDFPDNFLKCSVVDMMIQQAFVNYLDEKWQMMSGIPLQNNAEQLFKYLSDFPKTFKQYSDLEKFRQRVVNSIYDQRADTLKALVSDKSYSDAYDYLNQYIFVKYKDQYSGIEYEYDSVKDYFPLKNTLPFEISKKSIQGGNWIRAKEMLSKITKDFPEYDEVEKMMSNVNYQLQEQK